MNSTVDKIAAIKTVPILTEGAELIDGDRWKSRFGVELLTQHLVR